MKKIITLHFENLKNSQHFNFMDFVKAAITQYAIADGKYDKFVTKFLAAFDAENEAYEKYDRKTLSKRIADQNTVRQVKFKLLRDIINAIRRTAHEEKRLAAERLLGAMDLYGGIKIPGLPMDSMTGVLTNLIEDFFDKYDADVQLLEIGGAVQNLRAENEAFKQLISLRTQTDSEIGKEAMAKARAETDRTLRMLFDAINLDVEFGDADPALEPFINYMNTEIERYRIKIGQGVVGGNSSSGSTGGEAGPVFKTARFNFIDGRSESFPVEVGTVLVAPSNTTGYIWKPAVPEFMPTTNKTFREVPIDDKEVTATFHYLDHTEEEIRQIVGSILTAPANTAGCVWVPEVPATMPAEDTSYFEQQVSSGGGTGGEEQEPTKYWIAFVFADGTQEDAQYAEGATIQYPTPTTGYRWPASAPTVMPAHDVTVTEERNPNQPPPATGGGESGFD